MRGAVELSESLASLRRQPELVLASVGSQRLAAEQASFLEILHDAADIASIKPELAANRLGRDILAMGKLVHHPRLAERVGAIEHMLAEHPELLGIGAVERADSGDLAVGNAKRHGRGTRQILILAIVKYLFDFGKPVSKTHSMMIRLRNCVREERPSRRSKRACERLASGASPPSRK